MRDPRFLLAAQLATLCGALAVVSSATAQTGVSDDRVSLPDGPGSLEGLGENLSSAGNYGTSTFEFPIEVAEGHAGVTPVVGLFYDSGGGNTEVGMGWSLGVQSIERTTARGLPFYDLEDEFASNGGQRLVAIPNTDPPEYRARFEGGFVRYQWLDRGDGSGGYWRALNPDGTVSYYGATSDGTVDERSQVQGEAGTFRYMLRAVVDPYGHRMEYRYDRFGSAVLLSEIAYNFVEDEAHATVTFAYSDDGVRTDVISDCAPGFCEEIAHRLERVSVFASGERFAFYDVVYEDDSVSGGFSRVASIERYADLNGVITPYEASPVFGYTRALGADCVSGCEGPRLTVFDAGIDVSLAAGAATLVDINGDALPDVLDTSRDGAHRFFINELRPDGSQRFLDPVSSEVGGSAGHSLPAGHVQMLDVDGDGFTDLVNARTGEVLENLGVGADWTRQYALGATGGVESLDFELGDDGEPSDIGFLDYDNDKRIDVVRASAGGTQIYRSVGDGGFVVDEDVQDIGWSFGADRLEFEDMNGDGLADPVRVLAGSIEFRLNLGHGRWGEVQSVGGLPFGAEDLNFVELEDMNGDAQVDIVIVRDSAVEYLLSRNGATFDPLRRLDSAGGSPLPSRVGQTVIFADMNASGTTDVVWFGSTGEVTFLELFPERPNLLNYMDNGLGLITELSYQSAAELAARDGAAGAYPLPHPMTVLTESVSTDTIAQVTAVVTTTYLSGYYDGEERRFRGFEFVTEEWEGTEYAEEARFERTYHLGQGAPQLAGRLVRESVYGDGGLLRRDTREYDPDCAVDGLGDAASEVQWACLVTIYEDDFERGAEESYVRRATRFTYDGWGNVTGQYQEGIEAIGEQGCEPCAEGIAVCGDECLGDEQYTINEYVPVDVRDEREVWIPGLLMRATVSSGRDGATANVTEYHYDGEPFVGLPLGQAEVGNPNRVVGYVDGEAVPIDRARFDSHGNVVETLEPTARVEGHDGHRLYTFDETGLDLLQIDVQLSSSDGEPYTLTQTITWDDHSGGISELSEWRVAGAGVPAAAERFERRAYDAHGRIAAVTLAGNDSPSIEFEWRMQDGVFTRHMGARATDAEEFTKYTIDCYDGRGNDYQRRTLVSSGYEVSRSRMHDSRGYLVVSQLPYISDRSTCDIGLTGEPAQSETYYDALGRIVRTRFPDVDRRGGASERRLAYGSRSVTMWDQRDLDEEDSAYDTPEVHVLDGLGRLVERRVSLVAGEPALIDRFNYNGLGNLTLHIDPEGNRKQQAFDEFGRITRIDDPESGETLRAYDASSRLISETDNAGVEVRTQYDAFDRVSRRWTEGNAEATEVRYHYDFVDDCPADTCENLAGRIAEVSYPISTGQASDWFGYDAAGNPAYLGREIDGYRFEIRTEFDHLSRASRTTYPGSEGALVFEYDEHDRIQSIPGYAPNIQYDERGRLTSILYENGVETAWQYDGLSNVARIQTLEGSKALLDYRYELDRMGNVLRLIDETEYAEAGPTANAEYQYDALSRISRADLDERGDHAESLLYTYDSLSRLTSRIATGAGHLGELEYGGGPLRGVTRAGDVQFAYDRGGNMIMRGDQTLSWDDHGRLERVARGVEVLAEYDYTPDGTRLAARYGERTHYEIAPSFRVEDGVAVTTVAIGSIPIAEFATSQLAAQILPDLAPSAAGSPTPDGRITSADAWLAYASSEGLVDIRAEGTRAASAEAVLSSAVRVRLIGDNEAVQYLHTDHVGSVAAVTDADGEVVARNIFYPHGALRHQSRPGIEGWGISGKDEDQTGLTYFGARYLDPVVGRWTAPDPLFAELGSRELEWVDQATDRYSFALNNGVSRRDGDGQFVELAIFHISGAVVGALGGAISRTHHYMAREGNNRVRVEDVGFGLVQGAVAGYTAGPGGALIRLAANVLGAQVVHRIQRSFSPLATNIASTAVKFGLSAASLAVFGSPVGLVGGLVIAASWYALSFALRTETGRRFKRWASDGLSRAWVASGGQAAARSANRAFWSGVSGAAAGARRFARWAGPPIRSALASAANALGRLGAGRYHSSNRRLAQRMRRRAGAR